MTWKQIESAREVRLWIGQIVMPTLTAAAITLSIPEYRQAAIKFGNHIKESIENKVKKDRP